MKNSEGGTSVAPTPVEKVQELEDINIEALRPEGAAEAENIVLEDVHVPQAEVPVDSVKPMATTR
jgi:hypothetical protein